MTVFPAGAGTGIGSMPGDDPLAAATIVCGESSLAFVPELPARGIGADMIGRAAAILVDIPMDTSTSGYRLARGSSGVLRRARDFLAADLDAFEQAWEVSGRRGGEHSVKLSAVGPFTLAASVEMANGHKAIRDRGALADVSDSLAEGLARLAQDVRRRTDAQVLVQLDEPLLDRVLAGTVTPLTRLDPIPAIAEPDVIERVDRTIAGIGCPVAVHTCSDTVPWSALSQSRCAAIAIDVAALRGPADYDGLGGFVDSGRQVIFGAIGSGGPLPRSIEDVLVSIVTVTDRIGLPRAMVGGQALVSPTCGLAGADRQRAHASLALATESAAALATEPDIW